MKNLIAFALVSLSVSASFASQTHLVCTHKNFSALAIDVVADANTAAVKVISSVASNSNFPQKGEQAVLKEVKSGVDSRYLVLSNENTVAEGQRGFSLSILRADLSKGTFRAVLSASEDYSAMIYNQYEMSCDRQ